MPDKKAEQPTSAALERRWVTVDVANLRASSDDDGATKLKGYAAVFNVRTDLIWFEEVIAPGAFKRAIKEKQNVPALWNHNSDLVLGRVANDRLTLSEDDHGLHVEIEPADTQHGRDAIIDVAEGNVTQMSFAFRAIKQEWIEEENQPALRQILDVDLYDVSPVTYPAYPQTSISARSAENVWNDRREELEAPGLEPGIDEDASGAVEDIDTAGLEPAQEDETEALEALLDIIEIEI